MTMKEIVLLLAEMGNVVKYTQRQDGGIRITYINGKHFSGSTGNALARNMVGATISEARITQLQRIKTPKGEFGHKKKDIIDDETKKFIRKLQRKFRKKGKTEGIPTIRLYRQNIADFGKKEADRLLKEDLRYIEGLAYTKNIEALIERLNQDNMSLQSADITNLINRIESMTPILKDTTLMEIYAALYDLEQLSKAKIGIEDKDIKTFVNKANNYLNQN